ncbi:hypothetical protein BCP12_194 [Bacillus phage BCP12]|uniref:Uncharacterized protein n=1 Tax=Bacillus phage BCP12 TaxID=1913122 RepID=A0A2S0CS93_9CAUD|nr:hypothetical protein BCP12_194 [Bacillus phage BCP12]
MIFNNPNGGNPYEHNNEQLLDRETVNNYTLEIMV